MATGFLAVTALFPLHAGAEGETIAALDVAGAQKIEPATILRRSGLTVGAQADQATLREAVKAVYRMGYFEDVSIEREPATGGVRVIVRVEERPALTEIRYEGYDQVSLDTIKEQVTLTVPQPFIDPRAIGAAADKLQQYYVGEGYGEARVIPITKTVAPGAVSVTFFIQEGRRSKIRAVRFDGNRAVSSKALRKVVSTKPYFWLTSWVTGRGIYKQDVLDQDVERLRDHYLNEGYVQIQIGTPRVISLDRGGVEVVFPIVEGERYTVDTIQFSGNTVFSIAELAEGLALRQDAVFRRNLLRQDITTLTDRYGERGYAFVDIRPQFTPNAETREIALVYEIREGQPVTVRTITVSGNDKTYDKVIRRELRVAEQEIVDTKALKRSFQRINNLNFFENVEILPQPIGDDQMDLLVRVKEKPTGTFSIGGGYSSVDGPVFQADITQGNLFGRGQLLRARVEKSTRRTANYTLTFREPYLFDRPVSGTIDLFSQERNFNTYKDSRAGGSLSLNKAFGEYVSAGLSYTRETTKVFDLDATLTDPNNPVVQAANRGKTTTSSLGLSLARDTRDFFFDPREGQRHSLAVENAGGLLGGDNRFYKVVTDHSAFFPVWWNTVFSAHLRLGYLGGSVIPFSERFVVGGINSVRGFEFGFAGPINELNKDVLGGNKEVILNIEYVFPLVQEAKMKGLLFFDAGRAFGENERISFGEVDRECLDGTIDGTIDGIPDRERARLIRYSAGFGIRMLLPIGPIRLEFGYNLDPQCDERSEFFPEFTIGTLF